MDISVEFFQSQEKWDYRPWVILTFGNEIVTNSNREGYLVTGLGSKPKVTRSNLIGLNLEILGFSNPTRVNLSLVHTKGYPM